MNVTIVAKTYPSREFQMQAEASRIESILDVQAYRHMCRSASGLLRSERAGHLMEETDVVHDAILRLKCGPRQAEFNGQTHLLATTKIVMRRQLIDHARRRQAERTRLGTRVSLVPELLQTNEEPVLRLILNESLERLAKYKARLYDVVVAHFFQGLLVREMAGLLNKSERTIKRDLKEAYKWLRYEMTRRPESQSVESRERRKAREVRMAARRNGRAETKNASHRGMPSERQLARAQAAPGQTSWLVPNKQPTNVA